MMYAVYAVNKTGRTTIYNQSWLTVGEYARSVGIESPTLSMEDNEAGSFTFIMPKDNQGYDKIERMVTEIQICEVAFNKNKTARTENEIWRGRVIEEEEDFMHNKRFMCEGELAYLNDTLQPQAKYERSKTVPKAFFTAILKIHNSKVPKKKQFKMGDCEFTEWLSTEAKKWETPEKKGEYTSDDDKYIVTQYETTLDVINTAMEDLKHPHLRIKRNANGERVIDFLKDADDGGTWGKVRIQNQEVRLGVNLLDCTKSYDLSGLCTVMIPLGAQKEGNKANLGPPLDLTYVSMPGNLGVTLNEQGEVIGIPDDPSFITAVFKNLKKGDKFFYTGRNYNGYGMYSFQDSKGTVIDHKQSDTSKAQEGKKTDLVETLIEVPDGATMLYVSGCNDDSLQLRVNKYLEDVDAEKYVTVKDIEDNTKGRHKKAKGEMHVINTELFDKYGWIEKVNQFENITDPKLLYDRTIKYFEEDIYEDLVLEVRVIDMNLIDPDYEPFRIGYCVPVISGPHDLEKDFPISKLDIYLDRPEQSTVSLGKRKRKTFTGITTKSSADIKKEVKLTTRTTTSRMSAAIDHATDMIKNGMKGYVTFVRGDVKGPDQADYEDVIEEILITDHPDYTKAKNVWRWNSGGFGHSSNGYDGPYDDVAITMDGQINGKYLIAETVSADTILGGVLKIGSDGTVASQMKIYALISDGHGGYEPAEVGTLDERGLEVQTYDTTDKEYKSVGVTDGSLKGFAKYPDSQGGTYHRTGYLNLVRKNENEPYDVTLSAEDIASVSGIGGRIIMRSNGHMIFRSGWDIYFRVNGSSSSVAYIDGNGIHNTQPYWIHGREGVDGSFSTPGGGTVSVQGGIITKIS